MYIVLKNDGLDCIVNSFQEFLYFKFDFYIEKSEQGSKSFYIRSKDYKIYMDKTYKLFSYGNEWKDNEIIQDFSVTQLKNFSRRFGFKIYKSELVN